MPPTISLLQCFDDAQSANTVSADYDKIAGIFEDLVSHLQRFKILEDRIPPLLELKVALARVLAALLVLCGICAKYVKMRRFGKHILCIPVLQKLLTCSRSISPLKPNV